MNSTIIYYTSNLEDEKFEEKIRQNILDVKGDLPLISVSQKPLVDFGTNICVGEVGYSYLNAFRQILIGAKIATTPFVTMCESDCLYPREGYFDFEPTDINKIYSYNENWILWKKEGINKFKKKLQTHGSMIYGRLWLIEFLNKCLKGLPKWSRDRKQGIPFYSPDQKFTYFSGDPIINIITGVNGRKSTSLMKDKPRDTLEYWGSCVDLKNKIFN
jgi:hypothetical protein